MKRCFSLLAAALVALFSFGLVPALAQEARIFDYAELLTPTEERVLTDEIAAFQKDTGMDFVLLTSDGDFSGDPQSVADDFYDEHGFGLDAENSGVLYYIDMEERWHYLSTTGRMIDYLTDARIESAIESCKRYLSAGDYAGGVSAMIGQARNAIGRGIPEDQYRYDVLTGERLTARHKALTSTEMIISAAIAALVGFCFCTIVKSRYRLKGSTYSYNFQQNSEADIYERSDDYLRTTTTRTRKSTPPSSGSSGGVGGSGVHTSSSGTSHGGGGGRF